MGAKWALACLLFVVPIDTAAPGEPAKPAVKTNLWPLRESPLSNAAIRRALEQPIAFDFIDTPLCCVKEYLSDLTGIRFTLDERSLRDVGADDASFSIDVRGIRLRSALNHMLRTHNLAWVVQDEGILITTREKADDLLETRVFDVRDLLWPSGRDLPGLKNLMVCAVDPTSLSWPGSGPPPFPSIEIKDCAVLVVRQSQPVVYDLEQLLTDLRAARRLASQPQDRASPVTRPSDTAIRHALQQRLDVEFRDVPLCEVAQHLSRAADVPIHVEGETPKDVDDVRDRPTTAQFRGLTLRTVLEQLTRQHKVAWTVADDALLITTSNRAAALLETRVFDVTDLVHADEQRPELFDHLESLGEVICRTVQPRTWDWVGGPGSIWGFELPGAKVLVVRQTYACREGVQRLLADLRAAKRGGSAIPRPRSPSAAGVYRLPETRLF
jgi:hypothetical protein